MVKKSIKNIGFILLHGAGYGSWIWDDVKPRLTYPSFAIDLLGRGKRQVVDLHKKTLENYVKAVMTDIEAIHVDKLILVSHSVSGTIALRIASHMPERIQSMIFVSAAVPQSGKSYLSLLPLGQQFLLQLVFKLTSGRPPKALIRQEGKDLPEEQVEKILENYVTESPHLFVDPVIWALPHDIPTYYFADQSSFPNEASINNLYPNKIVELATGHLPMLSKPEKLAGLLNSFT